MKTPLFSSLRQALHLARHAQQHPELSTDDILTEWQARQISRRQFLRSTGRAGMVFGAGALLGNGLLPLLTGRGKPNIAVVGAGLGGLSAGYYLRRKGVLATVFEADKRVGGRVKSARIFGGGQLNTEIGAEFIDTSHVDMLHLANLLQLDGAHLMDVDQDTFGVRDAFYIEGRHYTLNEVITEFAAAYPKIEADRKRMNGRHAAEYDRMSMAEYIGNLPVSPWVKKMLDAAFIGENGLETAEQSAAILVDILEIRDGKEFLPFGDSDERFKVIGGNEQIPQGLASILREQIRYEHRLVKVRENANHSITLFFNENGTTREANFDAVILSVPFSVLRDVEFDMDLPPVKQRVIRELGYGTNAKFILETHDRPWRTAGYRGFLFNERVSNGWDCSQMQLNNAGAGAFTVFYGGKRGLEAKKGTDKEQLDYVLPVLEGVFPGTRNSLTGKSEIAAWPSNPFVKASYSCFKPGQITDFEGAAIAPVRRLYFAGEHCSADYWGFMNGAAETGRIAAEKVLRKMRVK